MVIDKDGENALLFKMEKDEVKTVKINYQMNLSKEHNILDFIGRSVFLERRGHSDKAYVAQILPFQPSSCRKVILFMLFYIQFLVKRYEKLSWNKSWI